MEVNGPVGLELLQGNRLMVTIWCSSWTCLDVKTQIENDIKNESKQEHKA